MTDPLIEPCSIDALLLPVELQRVNHTASTNMADSTRQNAARPTIYLVMWNHTPIEASDALPATPATPHAPELVLERVMERVEQLLVRYEELQRTSAFLSGQVNALTEERDSLKSRLSAARARVDALLERLPENAVAQLRSSAGADS